MKSVSLKKTFLLSRVIAISVIVISLLCSMVSAFAAQMVDAFDDVDDAILIEAAQPVLAAHEEHYNIESVKIIASTKTEKEDGGFYVEYCVEMAAQLKYKSATEIPLIRGLASMLDIDSQNLTVQEFAEMVNSKESIDKITEEVSARAATLEQKLTDEEAVAEIVASKIISFVEGIENEHIGVTSTYSIGIRAEFEKKAT